jgi:hypothetical protein
MSSLKAYINTSQKDTQAYKDAIAAALSLARLNTGQAITKIVVLVPQKGSTAHGMFDGVFSPQNVTKMLTGGYKPTPNDPLIKVEAATTYTSSGHATEIVVACGVDSETLFDIEDFSSVSNIIAIPWYLGDLDKWIKTWGPPELHKNPLPLSPYPGLSCVEEEALRELTGYVDRNASLHSHSNESVAMTFLATLHKYVPTLDAEAVRAHLTRVGKWKAKYAREAEAAIVKLQSGGSLRGAKKEQFANHYTRWQKACNQATQVAATAIAPTTPAVP